MDIKSLFKKKEVDEEKADFNEDNVIRVGKYEFPMDAIEVSTAVRIAQIVGVIVAIAVLAAIMYLLYFVSSEFGLLDVFDDGNSGDSGDETSQVQIDKNSIAKDSQDVWPPNPALG